MLEQAIEKALEKGYQEMKIQKRDLENKFVSAVSLKARIPGLEVTTGDGRRQ